MMEITLKFADAGDDGQYDMNKAQRAIRADEAFSVLWDIDQQLRAIEKWDEKVTDRELVIIDEIRQKISESGLMEIYD